MREPEATSGPDGVRVKKRARALIIHDGDQQTADPARLISKERFKWSMARAKPHTEADDPIKSVRNVLSLSDRDFARWVDRVIDAGVN